MNDDDLTLEGYRRLACGLLVRSLRDAANLNGHHVARDLGLPEGLTLAREARRWLAGDYARGLVLLLGFDLSKLERLIDDLPDLPRGAGEQLELEGFLYGD